MRTLEYLTGPTAELFWPGVAAGVAIALQGAALSVFVTLKRLAFIGQGVSHAAFGGIGLAAALGLAGGAWFPAVAVFCVASAWGIALLDERGKRGRARAGSTDTLIGVFLVGAMALGALLVAVYARAPGAARFPGWESALFGSILSVGPTDAAVAWGSATATLATLLWFRRPMLLWAFDEVAAEAAGAPTRAMRLLLLTLLAIAVVTAMKLAGVVLASALLTIPGAAALRVTRRLAPAFLLSGAAALVGAGAGLIGAFEFDLPPGACVVAALIVIYAGACAAGGLLGGAAPGGIRKEAAG